MFGVWLGKGFVVFSTMGLLSWLPGTSRLYLWAPAGPLRLDLVPGAGPWPCAAPPWAAPICGLATTGNLFIAPSVLLSLLWRFPGAGDLSLVRSAIALCLASMAARRLLSSVDERARARAFVAMAAGPPSPPRDEDCRFSSPKIASL